MTIDGSQATFIPANRAVTWHLTGPNNNGELFQLENLVGFTNLINGVTQSFFRIRSS